MGIKLINKQQYVNQRIKQINSMPITQQLKNKRIKELIKTIKPCQHKENSSKI